MAAEWTDLVDPTREELLSALPVTADPEAIEALAASSGENRHPRPLLESHGTYAFGVFVVPHARLDEDRIDYLEIDLVATPQHVVTVRKSGRGGALASVDALANTFEEGGSAGELVHAVADAAADAFLDLLDALYDEIDELEGHVDDLAGPVVRRRMAELRHELLQARKSASATRASVRRVVDGGVDAAGGLLFPKTLTGLFVDTYETLVRTAEEFDVARDLLASVRDYFQAKITETQNDVVKKLTVIAALVLVPSFIVGFYGQNFDGAFDEGYWTLSVSVGTILAATVVQLVLFRWRRWI